MKRENPKKKARSADIIPPSVPSFAERVIGSKRTTEQYVQLVTHLLNCYDRVEIDEICKSNFFPNVRHSLMLVRGNDLYPIATYREIRGNTSLASYVYATVSGIPDGTTELKFVTWRCIDGDDAEAKVVIITEMICAGTKSFETCIFVPDQATEDQIELTNTALLSLQALSNASTSEGKESSADSTAEDSSSHSAQVNESNDLTYLQPYASVLSEFVAPPSHLISQSPSTSAEFDSEQMLTMTGILADQGKFDIRALPAKISELYHYASTSSGNERLNSYFQRRTVKPLQNWRSIEQMKIFFGDESSIYKPVQRKAEPVMFNIRGQFEIYVNEAGMICKTRVIIR